MPMPLLVIVDQDPVIRARTESLFADRYECLATGAPEEALAWARARTPAAVVVDFPTPLRQGGSLAAALKADPATARIPVVAYSSWDYARTRATARQIGCEEFVARSADPSELIEAVERVAGRREPALHG